MFNLISSFFNNRPSNHKWLLIRSWWTWSWSNSRTCSTSYNNRHPSTTPSPKSKCNTNFRARFSSTNNFSRSRIFRCNNSSKISSILETQIWRRIILRRVAWVQTLIRFRRTRKVLCFRERGWVFPILLIWKIRSHMIRLVWIWWTTSITLKVRLSR